MLPQNPQQASVDIFLLMLALTLRNMRKHRESPHDLALDVTDAIQGRLDLLEQYPNRSIEVAPVHIEEARQMAQYLVHLLMEPGFAEADLEDLP